MIRELAMRTAVCVSLALALPAAGMAADAREELRIRTASGAVHAFRIELAISPEAQARGLMYRETLEDTQGMLFHWRGSRERTMWMKNTFIPLDMLFVRGNGIIAHIHERAVPLSTRAIRSRGPVRAVLELRGGIVKKLGIRKGDRVLHRLLGR